MSDYTDEQTSEDNKNGRIRFRYTDALEVKPHFVLGVPIEELAKELAQKRGASVEQAQAFLVRIRARDGWIEQRNQHLTAMARLAEQKTQTDRATAIANTQGAVADRLVQLGLEEITTTKSATRSEALKTLEMGYRFSYRANNLPDHIVDPTVVSGNRDSEINRASEIQSMSREEMIALMKRLTDNSPVEKQDDKVE